MEMAGDLIPKRRERKGGRREREKGGRRERKGRQERGEKNEIRRRWLGLEKLEEENDDSFQGN